MSGSVSVIVNQALLQSVLAEWRRQLKSRPGDFMSLEEEDSLSPEQYGEATAPYLMDLLQQFALGE